MNTPNFNEFPEVWGPHYWFFLHTIAFAYPNHPNEITKKKFYDLIQNMPVFIPDPKMGSEFIHILDEYPVQPYLDSRTALVEWVHYIHNVFNTRLGRPAVDMNVFLLQYWEKFKKIEVKQENNKRWFKVLMFMSILAAGCCIGYLHLGVKS